MRLSINFAKYTKFSLMLVVSFFFICYSKAEASSPKVEKQDLISFGEIVGNDFVFTDSNGEKFSFADLKGRVVIIAFSALWCPNCPVVLKSLDELKRKLLQRKIFNVEIYALNIGDEKAKTVAEHYKKYNISSLKAFDSITNVNGVDGVPACFVFDTSGKPVSMYLGWNDFSSKNFINFLKKLAKKENNWHLNKERSKIGSGYVGKNMEILKYGNPILKKKCKRVKVGDAEIVELLNRMVDTMHEANGVGLAAPQVGILKRVVVIDLHQNPEKIYKMINPKIVWKSEEKEEFQEGCLSIPGVFELVKRPASVSVEYLDESFKPCFIKEATGLLASCLQHEIDHLDGKLYIDRLSKLKKKKLMSEYEELQMQKSPEAKTCKKEIE